MKQICFIDGINEGFNEAAADRCVINRKQEDIERGYKKSRTYNILTCIPRILANVTGSNENELISEGISGIGSFALVSCKMSENLPAYINGKTSREFSDKILNWFSGVADATHSLMYSTKTPFPPGSKKAKLVGENNLMALYGNAYKMMFECMKYDKRKPYEFSPEELIYRFRILDSMLDGNIDELKMMGFAGKKADINICNAPFLSNNKSLAFDQMIGMAIVIKNRSNLPENVFNNIFYMLKSGDMSIQNLSNYGIEIPSNLGEYVKQYDCSSYERRLFFQDYKMFDQWDEVSTVKHMGQVYDVAQLRESNKTKQKRSFFKRILEKFHGKDQKLLEAPKIEHKTIQYYEAAEAPNPWKVDKKDIKTNNLSKTNDKDSKNTALENKNNSENELEL